MQLSEQEIKAIADRFNLDEVELAEFVRKSQKVKKGPWPARMAWWQNLKWLQDLNKKYQYLVPVLDALKNHKAVSKERNQYLDAEPYQVKDGKVTDYVLLDLSKSRNVIADQIGCSTDTLALYIRGLEKCQIVKYFNRGSKGRFYSMAYWMEYPVDPKNLKGEWDYKKVWLLTEKTSAQLKDFKLPR